MPSQGITAPTKMPTVLLLTGASNMSATMYRLYMKHVEQRAVSECNVRMLSGWLVANRNPPRNVAHAYCRIPRMDNVFGGVLCLEMRKAFLSRIKGRCPDVCDLCSTVLFYPVNGPIINNGVLNVRDRKNWEIWYFNNTFKLKQTYSDERMCGNNDVAKMLWRLRRKYVIWKGKMLVKRNLSDSADINIALCIVPDILCSIWQAMCAWEHLLLLVYVPCFM